MGALTQPSVLAARNLGFAYGGTAVFHGLDLDLRRGQMVVLLGPNGAGKTTLLRCLAKATAADGGFCLLRGNNWLRAAIQ